MKDKYTEMIRVGCLTCILGILEGILLELSKSDDKYKVLCEDMKKLERKLTIIEEDLKNEVCRQSKK